MFLSVFDLLKIGIGPSSSHTMGPMVAASRFLAELSQGNWPKPSGAEVYRIKAYLYGSLAFTGVGHATDRALTLGLCGFTPQTIDPDQMADIIEKIKQQKFIEPAGHPRYQFDFSQDIIFDFKEKLPYHTNGMAFEALDKENRLLLRRIYYSTGGGFVISEEESQRSANQTKQAHVPYPFSTAKEMLEMGEKSQLTIAQMVRANEVVLTKQQSLDNGLDSIWDTMDTCINRGLREEGELPGGLHIKRRAKHIMGRLEEKSRQNIMDPVMASDWLSVFALAVNEENAAGGRVVTAPTNGAAGVMPAVLRYYLKFYSPEEDIKVKIREYFLTASAIGGIIKQNASISGAEVGCQGEVGSAAAMAAAGLAALLGGTNAQIENAAEIALEHHLGMTCDPVAGLVQVPCIERNALGAAKAVLAASLALHGDGEHFVSLDACIETMRQTGEDMSDRYKETSLGGLAVNVVEC